MEPLEGKTRKLKIIRSATVPQSLNTFCKGLLQELSQKYEVVALSSPGQALQEISEREHVRTVAVPMERHVSLLKDCRSLVRMVKVFLQEKPAMVHSMTPKAGLICMVAAWMARVPVRVHTFTGLVFPTAKGLKKRILMWADVITSLCATHIIPEGEGVKNDLKKYGITSKSMDVLGFGNVRGVDMDYYSRRPEVIRKAEQLRVDSRLHEGCQHSSLFIFLFVGRIVRDKGINELCKAYQRIHEEYPGTRLWLVGDFEEELDPISDDSKALIRKEDNGIMAVGSKTGDELLAYYAAADCYVFPSYREGFPNTVLEAGAMGLPCIVTNINGSREIIAEGVNGTIIPSKDAEALYWAMKRMLDCPERRKGMATKARSMVATRFEQGFVRKCLFDYYDRILHEKSA